jgi:predicted permease
VELESVHDRYVADLRPVLLALSLAGAIVLLIVTLNVAVLTLLRALRRQREIAVRVALGANGRVVLRLLALEAALIAAGALGAGLAVTQLALRLLAPVIEERLGRAAPGGAAAIALDTTVLFAVAGATVAIALSMTFLPLLTPWRRQLAATLRSAGRTGTAGPAFRRMRDALIALEVGASLALLVGCGLMLRTVVNLVGTDLGIRTDGIERVRIALPASSYPDPVSLLPFYERLAAPLHGHAFAVTNFIPFYEVPTQRVEYEAGGGVAALDASVHAVSDGYFELFGIRASRGRGLLPADRAGAEAVAVVSETLARRLGPPGSAVGRRIRTPAERASGAAAGEWRTVVGVVGDTRQTHTDVDQRDVYVPFLQAPARYASLYFPSDGQRALTIEWLRETVARIDPAVLVSGDVTGSNRLAAEESRQLAGPRFLLSVLAAFAIFALLLAVLGMYGVTAYTVRQREREVAIRIAVGASVRAVVAMFLKEAGLVLLAGVAAGLLGAAAVARLLASQLYGVEPLDPATLVAACGFIVGAALLAAWLPATRAAAGDPRILNAD